MESACRVSFNGVIRGFKEKRHALTLSRDANEIKRVSGANISIRVWGFNPDVEILMLNDPRVQGFNLI